MVGPYLRPVLSQDYFGTILRFFSVVGEEIVAPKMAFVSEGKKIVRYYYILLGSSQVGAVTIDHNSHG